VPSYVVGVDPGMTGALAILDGDVLVEIHDMPVAGGSVSAQMLVTLERWAEPIYGTVVIEDVHSMPKQGVASSFKFGESKAVLVGMFAQAFRPVVFVAPQKWKRDLRLTRDKGACRQRASELWPADAKRFTRARDDGRAEAALIAHWYATRHLRVSP
jgi:crossover junction endodeoxyribonuclease RuvC